MAFDVHVLIDREGNPVASVTLPNSKRTRRVRLTDREAETLVELAKYAERRTAEGEK